MSSNNIINNELFLFADQDESLEQEETLDDLDSWRILIVDDEPEVHKVTQLALGDLTILGRKLEFSSVYNGEQTIEYLRNNPDIAIILLDVVMESDDAGLKAVKRIRDELNLHDVRIILRTGQPGYAPEVQIIAQYDINDYRTKTELTRTKLVASVFSSIRAYAQLVLIRTSRDFLDRLNTLNSKLLSQTSVNHFIDALVKGALDVFQTTGNGILLMANTDCDGSLSGDEFKLVYSTSGEVEIKEESYHEYLSKEQAILVSEAIREQKNIISDHCLTLYISSQSSTTIMQLDTAHQIEDTELLVQTFTSNIAFSLDNSLLLKKISNIAFKDQLTGLPNRAHFIGKLDELSESKKVVSVCIIDLEHFSDINHGLGFEVGNLLLNAISERLKVQLDEHVFIARIGADLYGLIGDDDNVTPQILDTLFEQSFHIEAHIISVNSYYGICRVIGSEDTGLGILKQTNIALNKAKKDGQSHWQYYNPEMEDETHWRLSMIRRLSSDFSKGKLQVWYQPQYCVETNKLIGAEALLRWPDGNGGFISPVTFIPLAEYSGLIVEIGYWVLKQACSQLRQLSQLGFHNLRMAINVSMPQFRDTTFIDAVIHTTQHFELSPSQVELEITESVVMDEPTRVINALKKLKTHGFKIAIDDFGTGFSSLSYLHQLPLDRIKVDREFVKEIGMGGDGVIAESIIHLGQKLGLSTIAEGIETEEQLDYIRKIGCEEVQGYLYAKPMPAEELVKHLTNHFKSHSI